MPGVYREKECPTCGKKHRKKGPYCSKACSNAGRGFEVRAKLSANARERGLPYIGQLAQKQMEEPPTAGALKWDPLGDNQFVDRDGDIWTVADDPWN